MADIIPTTDCPVFPYGLPTFTGAWDYEKTSNDPIGWINAMSCWADNQPQGVEMVRQYLAPSNDGERIFTRPAKPKPTTIYFIVSSAGPIKIGHARDPRRRMRDLQLAGPIELRLAATIAGSPSLERDYHARFAAHRLHGEWFAPHPDLLAEIARLTAPHCEDGD